MQLDRNEYPRRRQQLMANMSANSVAIIPSAPVTVRNRDVEHPYRQDSDFYYLTGFAEPHALLLLIPGRAEGECIVFCQDKNKEQEIWTGRRLGPEAAPTALACDEAFSINDVDELVPSLLAGRERIYTHMGLHADFDRQVMHWLNAVKAQVRLGVQAPYELHALDHLLHEQRLLKSAAEIALMQRAADISALAHGRAMQVVQPGMYEYQLEAEMTQVFMAAGSRWPAYPSIVGAGDNACILHYTENNAVIQDGDLILIDAGCELDYYASDITRTFPANGRFSEPQKALYQLVLDAQYAALEQVKPGNRWQQPHDAAVRVLVRGLLQLGLLQGEEDALIEQQAYRQFYMHKTGHWLGMDVHDVGDYRQDGEWRRFEAGMVLTVEPGLYVAPDDDSVDPQWRGIGIRIEDDVVVTEQGHHVLTSGVVKTVEEIEALMQSS